MPCCFDIEELIDDCDVIDFATVEQAMITLEAAKKHKKALICGTTGFQPRTEGMKKQVKQSL